MSSRKTLLSVRIYLLIGLVLVFLVLLLSKGKTAAPKTEAEKPAPVFLKEVFISGKDTLPYRLLFPETMEAGKKYPLLLFMHGAAQRGRDNERQLADIPNILTAADGRKKYPCFILVPQCPPEKQWVDVDWRDKEEIMPEQIAATGHCVLQLLDSLQRTQPIDPKRLYVTGISMGAFACWDLISRYPEKFAAAAPVSGGGDERQAPKLVHIPVWAFHGELDKVVQPSRSIHMVDAMNKAGGNARITLYPKEAHGCWGIVYAQPELFDWMFQQHLQ